MDLLNKWEAIAVMVIALSIGACTIATTYFNRGVAAEAIKAGLVQDSKGNWTKPVTTNVEAPKP